ncbi:ATP-binding protein [Streptomyces sp. NPDC006627]|uniref:ATP-binding protein n=1 Tax=Streptomyces sp. NPDC006627 TaxID=3154679 RepID=UPI0033A6271A
MTPITDVTFKATKPTLQESWIPANRQAHPRPLGAQLVVNSGDHWRRELMGTVKGLLDGYLPLDEDDVLDAVGVTIQLTPRPPGAPGPRRESVWVGRCRRIGAAKLNHWGMPTAFIEDMMLVASELATNALRYGTVLGFRLILTSDKVAIVVTDGSVDTPYVRKAAPDEEHGRGMLLVETFASDWGVRPDGMATWCTFTIPARQS